MPTLLDNIRVSTILPLKISHTPTNAAVLSWPGPSPSSVLQQTTNLALGPWEPAPEPITLVNGTNNQVILSPLNGNRFFRLTQP